MNGIILIDKPQDWTSHDVVAVAAFSDNISVWTPILPPWLKKEGG